METESEFTIRHGENVDDAAKRLGKRADETWDQLRARRAREDSLMRQDSGDGEESVPDAARARASFLARIGAAPRADEGDDGIAESDSAAQARKASDKRKVDAWKTSKKKAERGPAPPVSASEAEAEEEGEGDEEEGEEEELDAAGAQAAHSARLRDSWKEKRK